MVSGKRLGVTGVGHKCGVMTDESTVTSYEYTDDKSVWQEIREIQV